ncbi:alpha/beta fold hydrolase [Nocardia terpenica]|uniref:Alpha/beta fold hydrolase n=1 Tax=Nocardia terpenica TaxID=455432 RepID=A0A6G9Z370_9NOCA|nr:alpha/beta hydrolase [Nocardia terpenica]QIS19453.1 alpha/beta fold hydrolase [Nocardia terpenica]
MQALSRPWRLSQRVRVSGGEAAIDVFGDGPPVVLGHGTPASSYLWRNVIPALAARYRVHVWDMLGYGDSRLDSGVEPTIAWQARTLAELVRHWDLKAPRLVGHDIGAGVVMRAHLIDRVPATRIALLDGAVIGPWNTPFTAHLARHGDAYRTMPPHVFADIIVPRMRTATHLPMSDEVADAYLRPWSGIAGQHRWIRQAEVVDWRDTDTAVARLGEVAVPTLVLWGEQDAWLPLTMADRLTDAIPGARQQRIPDAGHFLPEDKPAETATALLDFLD